MVGSVWGPGPVPVQAAVTPLPLAVGGGEGLAEVSGLGEALRWATILIENESRLYPRPAVILDVDGTILKTQPEETVCLRGLHHLAVRCYQLGVALVVVTARESSPPALDFLEEQLAQCGITAQLIYMRRPGKDPRAMKAAARLDVGQAYKLLLSVGDQWWDITDEPVPRELADERVYIGRTAACLGFVKLPSEFA